MQDISTSITIPVEEYKKMLLDAHDAGRYLGETYRLRKELEELRKENDALRSSVDFYAKELAGGTDS